MVGIDDKVIDAWVFRHLQTAEDHLDRKLDTPTPFGTYVQLPKVVELVGSIPQGGLRLYASAGDVNSREGRLNRAYKAAMDMGYLMGALQYDEAGTLLTHDALPVATEALNTMTRGSEFGKALKSHVKANAERFPGDDEPLIVEFCMDPQYHTFTDDTETPAQVGRRYAEHVEGQAELFQKLSPGQRMLTASWGHEPCVTALAMHYLGMDAYDAKTLGGHARTAEGIKFELRQESSGLVTVTMNYHGNRAQKELVRP